MSKIHHNTDVQRSYAFDEVVRPKWIAVCYTCDWRGDPRVSDDNRYGSAYKLADADAIKHTVDE